MLGYNFMQRKVLKAKFSTPALANELGNELGYAIFLSFSHGAPLHP